jgi:hypothetical protein
LDIQDIEVTQPKRTMLLTVYEFMRLSGDDWSLGFRTRVGKRAGKLYRAVMGRAPRKRRLKTAGRNATCAFPHGILEQAFAQVSAEIVEMAEKLGVQGWTEQPTCWPGDTLRSRTETAVERMQADFPGITRADAVAIHRATRDRKPGTGPYYGKRPGHNTAADLLRELRRGLEDAVKAEFGDDLTDDELELLVRMRLRKDPELAASMAKLDILAKTHQPIG